MRRSTLTHAAQSDRSRGFGFIKMSSVEEATRCIQQLNGIVSRVYAYLSSMLTGLKELNGRRIRVDYSVTDRPHAPTPGEYMGHRRSQRDTYSSREYRDSYRDSYRDRDHRRHDRDRDRDPYGRDNRDWRDRRSPPARSGRYSPDYRKRRSYSRSPPRGSSPRKDFDGPSNGASNSSNHAENGGRW